MTFTRADRGLLTYEILRTVFNPDTAISIPGVNAIIRPCHLPTVPPRSDNAYNDLANALDEASDQMLRDLHNKFVYELQKPIISPERDQFSALYKKHHLRLFISHLGDPENKTFASNVASELAALRPIDGFVAHNNIPDGRKWRDALKQALNEAEAFLAITPPGFNKSIMCQHEVGWALARSIPLFVVRRGELPGGFLEELQRQENRRLSAKQTAEVVISWLDKQTALQVPPSSSQS
jgi:hypothetical protein